jgi:hypothetical protein
MQNNMAGPEKGRYLQSREILPAAVCFFFSGYFFSLLFGHENGTNMFVKNVGELVVEVLSFLALSMTLYHFGPWPIYHFLNLYTVGRNTWMGDQPTARPLPAHNTINIE